jgi:hypothetical protein
MLVLASPPEGAPAPAGSAFADHEDAALVYRLPDGVSVALDPDGEPDFVLLWYAGDLSRAEGGYLHVRLRWNLPVEPPAQPWREEPVPFEVARYRLTVRSSGVDAAGLGEWQPAMVDGPELASRGVALDTNAAQMLRALLWGAQGVVQVEVEALFAGLAPSLPVFVECDTQPLHALLSVLLPQEPVTVDHVEAAFTSLPSGSADPFRIHPLSDGATVPAADVVRAEVARRSLGLFFEPEAFDDEWTPRTYQLRSDRPPGHLVAWDLTTPRLEARTYRAMWSVTDLFADLADPSRRARFFPMVDRVSPFARMNVHVVKSWTLDPESVREVSVDVRATGPGGVPVMHSFVFPDDPDVTTFAATYPALTREFVLEQRFNTTLTPLEGDELPIVIQRPLLQTQGPFVEVTPASAGVVVVELSAHPHLFERAAAIEASIEVEGARRKTRLDRDRCVARPTLPAAENAVPWARVEAVATDALDSARLVLHEGPLPDGHLYLAQHRLEVLDPDPVVLRASPDTAARVGYLGVRLQAPDGPAHLFVIPPDGEVTWQCWRRSVFDPVHFRYQVEYTLHTSDGHETGLNVTDWTDYDRTTLEIEVPQPD